MNDDTGALIVRHERADEAAAIAALVADAFGRDAEARLVDRLRAAGVLTSSLVATTAGTLIGHVALSPVGIGGQSGPWLGLAPLAVHPAWRRRGIGALLVRHTVDAAAAAGAEAVFVLGEPGYYGRLGFEEACLLGWRCVYAVPAAFRVQRLGDRSGLPRTGTVRYHPEFDAL